MTAPAAGAVPAAVQYTYRASLVVGAVLPFVPSMLGQLPSDVLAAAALLLVAAGCLLVSSARERDGGWADFGAPITAAAPGIVILGITLLPPGMMLLLAPLFWVSAIWAGVPEGLGLQPPWSDYPIEVVFAPHQPIAVVIAAAAAGVVGYAVRRRRSALFQGVGLIAPVALPLGLVVAGAPWPAVALAMLAIGIGLAATAAIATLGMWRREFAGGQGFAYLTAGAAGCLATPATTVLALTLLTIAAGCAGWLGRVAARPAAWILSVAVGAVGAAAAVLAAGGTRHQAAFGVLAVALAALTLGAAIRARRYWESQALGTTAHLAMVGALILTFGSRAAAMLLVGTWTAAVIARIWWPGTSTMDRRFLAVHAAAWATIIWWLLIGPPASTITEEFTLPIAGVALLAGWANRRRQPLTKRWAAYGPAAALALLPTAKIAADTADQWRWLVLAVALAVGVAAVTLLRRRRSRIVPNGA